MCSVHTESALRSESARDSVILYSHWLVYAMTQKYEPPARHTGVSRRINAAWKPSIPKGEHLNYTQFHYISSGNTVYTHYLHTNVRLQHIYI